MKESAQCSRLQRSAQVPRHPLPFRKRHSAHSIIMYYAVWSLYVRGLYTDVRLILDSIGERVPHFSPRTLSHEKIITLFQFAIIFKLNPLFIQFHFFIRTSFIVQLFSLISFFFMITFQVWKQIRSRVKSEILVESEFFLKLKVLYVVFL